MVGCVSIRAFPYVHLAAFIAVGCGPMPLGGACPFVSQRDPSVLDDAVFFPVWGVCVTLVLARSGCFFELYKTLLSLLSLLFLLWVCPSWERFGSCPRLLSCESWPIQCCLGGRAFSLSPICSLVL